MAKTIVANHKSPLQEYLAQITAKGSKIELKPDGEYDSRTLPLDRTNYSLYDADGRQGANVNPQSTDEHARDVYKDQLTEDFETLRREPENVESLLKYAKKLSDSKYYDLSENLLGRAISLDRDNPEAYLLLAVVNSIFPGEKIPTYDADNIAGMPPQDRDEALRYHNLAELLSKEGLTKLEARSMPEDMKGKLEISLLSCLMDSLSQQNKQDEYEQVQQRFVEAARKDPDSIELRHRLSEHQ